MLNDVLNAAIFAGIEDQNGWFVPSARQVCRLGLALEPFPDLCAWVASERLDAVFLHRPWSLTDTQSQTLRDAEIGVLAYHLAFDERLTTGFNPALATACGWGAPEVLGHKESRPLGMICTLPAPIAFDTVAAQLRVEFDDLEQVTPPAGNETVARVAVVGAMTDSLVREASARGAGVYVTGQWRQPARGAVRDTGLSVIALGHRRSELWGLRALAQTLSDRTSLEIVLRVV